MHERSLSVQLALPPLAAEQMLLLDKDLSTRESEYRGLLLPWQWLSATLDTSSRSWLQPAVEDRAAVVRIPSEHRDDSTATFATSKPRGLPPHAWGRLCVTTLPLGSALVWMRG